MKTFIWINGKDAVIFNAPSVEEAITKAQNLSDHSKEVLIREVDSICNNTSFEQEEEALKVIRMLIEDTEEGEQVTRTTINKAKRLLNQ